MPRFRPERAIEPRNLHFDLTDLPVFWHGGSAGRTIVFNALSITFPQGERLFIDAVKAYRDRIDDPDLTARIKGFIAQESVHSREHAQYNAILDTQGFSASKLERILTGHLVFFRRFGPRRILAATCALEHFTAALGHVLLAHPILLDGAHPAMKRLWSWHAVEEIEHKAVAYDVFTVATGGRGYGHRIISMLLTTVLLNLRFWGHVAVMLYDQRLLASPRAWFDVLDMTVGRYGLFRRIFLTWIDYFRPGFHPWDHNDYALMVARENDLGLAA